MRPGRRVLLVALLTLVAASIAPLIASGAADTTSSAPSGGGSRSGTDGRYREFGDGGGFLNILPPGQGSGLGSAGLDQVNRAIEGDGDFPDHYMDQQEMYDALLRAGDDLTDEDLDRYFKRASFGVARSDIGRVYRPHDDVTVVRDDSFGVAHIYGRTRYATIFAEGYTTAEDRLFQMDVLRHTGRGRLSELVGLSVGESRDRAQVADSPYTEADLRAQVDDLRESGPDGAAVADDLQAYADGVNELIARTERDAALLPAEYAELGAAPEPWVVEDTVAIASLVGGIFGRGGGRELTNECRLDALATDLGSEEEALAVFDDLHFSDDPESPTTSADESPYMTRPATVATADRRPAVDCGGLRAVSDAVTPPDHLRTGGLGDAVNLLPVQVGDSVTRITEALDAMTRPRDASNALLVAGEHTDTGHPIAVFGPQVGYAAPELVTEKDVHGPGIDARGVAFLGVDAYVQLGRGDTYAWSATSSTADNVDKVVLRLCEPGGGVPTVDSKGYEHDGVCVRLDTWEHSIDAPTTPFSAAATASWHVELAPDYGPVSYRGALDDGTPIAIATHRSTYAAELRSAIGFKELNDPRFMAGGFDAFREATGEHIDYTFNWFYVDADDIGYQHSCLCPLRDPRVDPYFPTWATGEYDWQGFLEVDEQPHALNPDSGYLASWNNRPAPGFTANDGNFSYGPVHRSLLLSRRIEERIAASSDDEQGLITRSDVVEMMIDAATADLRGAEVLPVLLDAMGEPPYGAGGRLLDVRDRLSTWADLGAHRVDADGDGEYDDAAAPAVMDAWWPRIVASMFADAGHPFDTLEVAIDDPPSTHGGSAFASGAYGQVVRDLRSLLGDPAAAESEAAPAFSRSYCGNGDRLECAAALWGSLREAVADLSEEFGSEKVTSWRRAVADDEIRYQGFFARVPPLDWQNRPTFQQVVQLETERSTGDTGGRPTTGTRNRRAGAPVGWVVVGIVLFAAVSSVAVVRLRRRRRLRRS